MSRAKADLDTITLRSRTLNKQLSDAQVTHPKKLIINEELGFRESNLLFLERLSWIEDLEVVVYRKLDYEPVLQLAKLRSLSLSERVHIDLSAFPKLEEFSGTWDRALNLGGSRNLKSLALDGFPDDTLDSLSPCLQLQHIGIVAPKLQSLEGCGSDPEQGRRGDPERRVSERAA